MYLSAAKARLLSEVMVTLAEPHEEAQIRQRIGEQLLGLLEADHYASYVWNDEAGIFMDRVALNMCPRNLSAYEAYYQYHDPITSLLQQRRGPTLVGQVMPQSELVRTEFFNDFLYRDGLYWGVNLYAWDGDRNIGDMRIWRGRRRDNFDAESVGILETRRGSGLFVGEFSLESLLDNLPYVLMSSLQDLADLFEIRHTLEAAMIGTAIANLTQGQVEQLQYLVECMRQNAERGDDFCQEDREFHQCLFANVGNNVLLMLLDTFWLTFRKASQQTDIQDIEPLNTYRSHAAIAAAVIARDETKALAALDWHYDDLNNRLQRTRQERGWES